MARPEGLPRLLLSLPEGVVLRDTFGEDLGNCGGTRSHLLSLHEGQ